MSSKIMAVYDPRGILAAREEVDPGEGFYFAHEAFKRMYGVDWTDKEAKMPEYSPDLAVISSECEIITKFEATPSGIYRAEYPSNSILVEIVAKTDEDCAKLAAWAEELGAEVCHA